MKIKRRYCPFGHVDYEINPFTFSDTVLNSEKLYCPICGATLIENTEVEGMNEPNNWYDEENIKSVNVTISGGGKTKMSKKDVIKILTDIIEDIENNRLEITNLDKNINIKPKYYGTVNMEKILELNLEGEYDEI